MTEFLQFLVAHGYVVIFAWVVLDQAELPLPTLPLLLAAVALAGTGELSLLGIFVVCTLAVVSLDLFWVGRLRGVLDGCGLRNRNSWASGDLP